ncbi:hydantoinase B/oxoprolinase family protein [Sphingomonas sp. G-3-2-10]|nr:hydantoinase B/oxoprolinase family protein [Sphingomonas sp. G-3-2-10]NML08385.1 hydantoinase B/oxoprolinase family protein [Sphingomonas sp. G-3-2-10]
MIDRNRDPVLTEVVRNALAMVAEEAGIAAARSASSPFVSQASAIACALFDARGRLVAQTAGGLLHVSALQVMLRDVMVSHPAATLVEGDAIILNDPFRGGIHPTDVGAFRPIFHDGELAFYCGAMMIVSDLGGLSAGGLPANATETFHEGIVLPSLKFFAGGARVPEVEALLRANSRTPQRIVGDVEALVIGGNIAAARMAALIGRHGIETVRGIIEQLFDHAERMTRHGIAAMPDGVYRGRYDIEEDGAESGRLFRVAAEVTVTGDRCRFDFTGTSPQARGAINSSFSQSLSAVVFALRCYLDPEIPLNEGFYRCIEVTLPEGTLVNPNHPAACNLRMATVHAMIDAVSRAFAEAYPDHAIAAPGVVATVTAHGKQPGGGANWSFLDVFFGVGGARTGADGADGSPFVLYGASNYDRNIESYELEFPILYHEYRLLTDSGGAGRQRGGCGLVKTVEFLVDADITVRGTDRYLVPPQGVAGGLPGSPGAWILNRGRADALDLPPKKTNHRIRAGDTLTMIAAGGGGLGDPRERARNAVRADIADGYVSLAAARDIYGHDAEGGA